MNKLLYTSFLVAASLSGCHHDSDSPAPSDELAGTWRLTGLQCYCPPNQPVPDEVLTLDAGLHFQLFRNGSLLASGTYATGTYPGCSGTPVSSQIKLTSGAPLTANIALPGGTYTVQNNTLVLDQCSAADGPKYTYKRQ